jgi:hypothetical protein
VPEKHVLQAHMHTLRDGRMSGSQYRRALNCWTAEEATDIDGLLEVRIGL